MNAHDLFLLGRTLMKLGGRAIPDADASGTPSSVRTLLTDVLAHPDSSIGEMAARTGFPQSHVSSAVARLRAVGALKTRPDPGDARRTLVHASGKVRANRRGQRGLDEVLVGALTDRLGPEGARRLAEVTQALELVAETLRPAPSAPTNRKRDRGRGRAA